MRHLFSLRLIYKMDVIGSECIQGIHGKLHSRPHFEWIVMSFGLSNASSTFIWFMNHILEPCIGISMEVYFDDILVYSKNEVEHQVHLHQVFSILYEQKLFANLKECSFCTSSVVFSGYMVTQDGFKMDPSKIDTILNWPIPSFMHDVRSFHGLAFFYR